MRLRPAGMLVSGRRSQTARARIIAPGPGEAGWKMEVGAPAERPRGNTMAALTKKKNQTDRVP